MKLLPQIFLLLLWFTTLNATQKSSNKNNLTESTIASSYPHAELEASPEGREFLGCYERVSRAYFLLSAGKIGFGVFKNSINLMKSSWTKFKTSNFFANYKTLNPTNATKLESEVKNVIEEADKLDGVVVSGVGSVFTHIPTSGVIITNNAKQGTFLLGSYPTDLQYILSELNYPKIQNVDFNFPVPSGQKFNLLNISDEAYNYWVANGGFFTKVNGPWIDAAVNQGADIIVVSKIETLYNSPGVLSGFGKEIHRLEWKHGYRFDPTTKMMVPPSKANGLPTKTLQSEYTHN
jgi:hypothetical protein